jgi:hypothetical protein
MKQKFCVVWSGLVDEFVRSARPLGLSMGKFTKEKRELIGMFSTCPSSDVKMEY